MTVDMAAARPPLSPQQHKLLAYIVAFKLAHDGCAPNTQEMRVALGLHSTSGVPFHLGALEHKGYIRITRAGRIRRARTIQVVGATWTPPASLPENIT